MCFHSLMISHHITAGVQNMSAQWGNKKTETNNAMVFSVLTIRLILKLVSNLKF